MKHAWVYALQMFPDGIDGADLIGVFGSEDKAKLYADRWIERRGLGPVEWATVSEQEQGEFQHTYDLLVIEGYLVQFDLDGGDF